MFSKLERKIAFRYLRTKRKDGFISLISIVSLIGIMLGVATLIIVMSVMDGFHDTLLNRILGMNGHVVIYHQEGAIKDYEFLIDKILQNKISNEISKIVPIAEGEVMVSAKGNNSGAMIRGIEIKDLEQIPNIKIYGKKLQDIKDNELIIGSNLSRRLRVVKDDNISILSANMKSSTLFGTMPRIVSYPVKSSFFVGMHEYDSGYIFTTLNTAQRYLNIDKSVTHLDLFLKDPHHTEKILKTLNNLLPEGFVIRDWKDLNSGFVGALQVESNVMFLILMLIIIVAVFNIVSSLVMLVKDKSKDIAVLRTFGVSKKSIMKIFILNGSCIGLMGSVVGVILGIVISLNIEKIRQLIQSISGRDLFPAELYYLSELPAKLSFYNVFGIFFIAVLLAILATIYPAWKASKTDPIEVLRGE